MEAPMTANNAFDGDSNCEINDSLVIQQQVAQKTLLSSDSSHLDNFHLDCLEYLCYQAMLIPDDDGVLLRRYQFDIERILKTISSRSDNNTSVTLSEQLLTTTSSKSYQSRVLLQRGSHLYNRLQLAALRFDIGQLHLQDITRSTNDARTKCKPSSQVWTKLQDQLQSVHDQLQSVLEGIEEKVVEKDGLNESDEVNPLEEEYARVVKSLKVITALTKLQESLLSIPIQLENTDIVQRKTASEKRLLTATFLLKKQQQAVDEYNQSLLAIFESSSSSSSHEQGLGHPGCDMEDKDHLVDDNTEDSCARIDEDVTTQTAAQTSSVPKELLSFVLNDMYHSGSPKTTRPVLYQQSTNNRIKQGGNVHTGKHHKNLGDELVQHIDDILLSSLYLPLNDTSMKARKVANKKQSGAKTYAYSIESLKEMIRSLLLKCSMQVFDEPQFVRLGYPAVKNSSTQIPSNPLDCRISSLDANKKSTDAQDIAQQQEQIDALPRNSNVIQPDNCPTELASDKGRRMEESPVPASVTGRSKLVGKGLSLKFSGNYSKKDRVNNVTFHNSQQRIKRNSLSRTRFGSDNQVIREDIDEKDRMKSKRMVGILIRKYSLLERPAYRNATTATNCATRLGSYKPGSIGFGGYFAKRRIELHSDCDESAGIPESKSGECNESKKGETVQSFKRRKFLVFGTPESTTRKHKTTSDVAHAMADGVGTGAGDIVAMRNQVASAPELDQYSENSNTIAAVLEPNLFNSPAPLHATQDDMPIEVDSSSKPNRNETEETHDPTQEKKKLRNRIPFSDTEIQAIMEGVNKHSVGNWVQIQKNDARLARRTPGQIKDKYRNMISKS